jgi:hypothetical protein
MTTKYLSTGQTSCHDVVGQAVPCAGSGQDAEFQAGRPWPQARFEVENEWVLDQLTGLMWPRNANLAEYPLTWQEGLDLVADMNRQYFLGFSDWRLPNRRELRSLMSHQTRKPALPENHPFTHIFSSWYWTATSAAISPDHAWYVHMEGARMFYGGKDQSYLLWPVRGTGNGVLPATGQDRCFDAHGRDISPICLRAGCLPATHSSLRAAAVLTFRTVMRMRCTKALKRSCSRYGMMFWCIRRTTTRTDTFPR